MESVSAFRELRKIELSLEPYIKKRREVANLRWDLTYKLTDQQPLSKPLSLTDQGDIASHSQASLVLHQEYLRALQRNIKAKESHASSLKSNFQSSSQTHDVDPESQRRRVLGLLEARQANDKLSIMQGYIDKLSRRTVANTSQNDLNSSADVIGSPPTIPPEILDLSTYKTSQIDELNDIVDKLEKTVLRAKMLLKREQRLLFEFQSGSYRSLEGTPRGMQMNALGVTRNELIHWIENELSHGGENSLDDGDVGQLRIGQEPGIQLVHDPLSTSSIRYIEYISSRRRLVSTITTESSLPSLTAISSKDYDLTVEQGKTAPPVSKPLAASSLHELVSLSREQKSAVLQKSFTAIALSKQLKIVAQLLDRLVDESHLLNTSSSTSQNFLRSSKAQESALFVDEIIANEQPNYSRQAHAWASASQLAHESTYRSVTDNLETGGSALLEAQDSLLELLALLGTDNNGKDGPHDGALDIWADLHGKLGVL